MDESTENAIEQLMMIPKTDILQIISKTGSKNGISEPGPKEITLKRTKLSLSYAGYFLINIKYLDHFWADTLYVYIYMPPAY